MFQATNQDISDMYGYVSKKQTLEVFAAELRLGVQKDLDTGWLDIGQ